MTDIGFIEHRKAIEDDRFFKDESRIGGGNAEEIFFPENETEISLILKFCAENSIKATVAGASTGITGAAVPFGGIVISMKKFNKIHGLGFKQERFFLKVGAAVTLSKIAETLMSKETSGFIELTENALNMFNNSPDRWLYPVDPTEMSAQIGGTVATNASGAATYRFGPTRDWIKSIVTVLPNGEVHKIERGKCFANAFGEFDFAGKKFKRATYEMPKCKNASGLYSKQDMDIIDLFIGSEGILGIISEVEIWLEKKNPSLSIVQFFPSDNDALFFVKKLKKSDLKPDFIEFIGESGLNLIKTRIKNGYITLDLPEFKENHNSAVFFDIHIDKEKIADLEQEIREISEHPEESWCAWENCETERIKAFRHAIPESVNATIAEIKKKYPLVHKLGTDFAVSDDKFEELAAFYREILGKSDLKYAVFGHIGNNHLHINMLPANYDELEKAKEIYAIMAKKVLELKGTVSAEHGIGKIKHKYLEMMFGEEGVNEMRRIKKVFDPAMILNNGNMFS